MLSSRQESPPRRLRIPYGWVLDGRHGGESYRFSFQEQEGDDEIKGENNSINYKYRMHDTRIGRFFVIDPLSDEYPHNSPYAFSENMVIHAIELEGLEAHVLTKDESGEFTLSYDWYMDPVEDPNNQLYFNGEVVNVSSLANQFDIQLFDPISYPVEKLGSEDYYLDYGYLNVKLFNRETYGKVSSLGKKFINKATMGLQVAIEDELRSLREKGGGISAEFELGGQFRSFAFQTHVPAYVDAGFLRLDILDKIHIGLTPPLRYITSKEGIEQMNRILVLQDEFYENNPDIYKWHLIKYKYFQSNTGSDLMKKKFVDEIINFVR